MSSLKWDTEWNFSSELPLFVVSLSNLLVASIDPAPSEMSGIWVWSYEALLILGLFTLIKSLL